MRIQLERKRYPCRDKLRCTICLQLFEVGQMRSLLYQDCGLLQGDVCPHCAKLDAESFKQKMVLNARILLQQTASQHSQTVTLHTQALELLAVSKEDIKFPGVWQQAMTKLKALVEDTQELEAARLRLHEFDYHSQMLPRPRLDDDRTNNN